MIEKWGRTGSTTVPLKGVKFEIKYANGQFVDAAGGTLSSNGIYYSDSSGKITLSGVTGTVIVTELESVPGFTIDPDSQSQTVTKMCIRDRARSHQKGLAPSNIR